MTAQDSSRTPSAPEAEQAVLSCVLQRPDLLPEVLADGISPASFDDLRHRRLWEVLTAMHAADAAIDIVTSLAKLKDEPWFAATGGITWLSAIADYAPAPSNWSYYTAPLREAAERRDTIRICTEILNRTRTHVGPIGELRYANAPDLELLQQGNGGGKPLWLSLVEDGAELQARELAPVVEIVQGIVAELSKLSVVSSAKCFKTWLTIYLALCVAHGVAFIGRKTTRRKVLYVNLELKPETFTRRLQAIAKALDIAVDAQSFFHLSLRGKLAGLSVHDIVSQIIATAHKLGVTVVVIDPLFKLNTEGEENSSRDQTVFCNELDRLTTEGNCTAIFNDHSSKGNQSEKEPLDVIRGSSAKGGDLDAAMVLRKHEVDGAFRVDVVQRELAPIKPFVISWEYPLMQLRPDLSADQMKKAKGGATRQYGHADLLAAIIETTAEKPISISAWASAATIKRQTLGTYLPRLRAAGCIATVGEGSAARQYITEKGRKLASGSLEETP